jgi:hypothetical protein
MLSHILIALSLTLGVHAADEATDHSKDEAVDPNAPASAVAARPDTEGITKDTKGLSAKLGDIGDPKTAVDEGEKKTSWGPFQEGQADCLVAKDKPCCSVAIFSPPDADVKLPWGTKLDVTKIRPKSQKKEQLDPKKKDPLGKWVVDLNLHFEHTGQKGFLTCTLYTDKDRPITFGEVRKAFGKRLALP